jgi:hypothetical protein
MAYVPLGLELATPGATDGGEHGKGGGQADEWR